MVQKWLSYHDENSTVNIPSHIIQHVGCDINQWYECCILVEYSNQLIGIVLVSWIFESHIYGVIGDTMGIIRARGLFDQPIDLDNVRMNNVDGFNQFFQIPSRYLFKQNNPTPYKPHLTFEGGFHVYEIKGSFIGDLKEIQNVCGLCGGNPKYLCPFCFIVREDMKKPIDANNRDTEPRFYECNIEV